MYDFAQSLHELEGIIGSESLDEINIRFSNYIKITKSFVIEKKYIDREWRAELASYYAFTFYKDMNQFTTRIHFLTEKVQTIDDVEKIDEEKYLGYLVLRPRTVPHKILKAILVPIKEVFGVQQGEKLFINTCTFESHIGGKEFRFQSYPFYAQDSVVTVCAHANMYMNGMFMHKKHGMNRPYLKEFLKHTMEYFGRVVPSPGLTPIQMASILCKIGYSPVLERYETKEKTEVEKLLNIIDPYVESSLPPILMYSSHVVTIVGYSIEKGKKSYILFDDSGYHLSNLANTNCFAHKVSLTKLKRALKKAKEAFVMGFEFERQYFPLKSINLLFTPNAINDFKTRVLLVDSRKYKAAVKQSGVNAFEKINFPHYLWLIEETNKKTGKIISHTLTDASAHKNDINTIFAMWFEETVEFYRNGENIIDAKKNPINFSNLTEIIK